MPRGGKRAKAGRKPGSMNKITALKSAEPEIKKIKGAAAKRAVTAAAVLACVDEMGLWLDLVHHKDPSVRLKTLCYLTDQRDGKAKQRLEASGKDGAPLQFTVRSILDKPG
jgi:hypothetical protein